MTPEELDQFAERTQEQLDEPLATDPAPLVAGSLGYLDEMTLGPDFGEVAQ